jgi:competence protein ComEA
VTGGPAGDPGERPAALGRHRAAGREPRWDPGRRGAWSLWAAGLVAALLVVGWTWLDRPRVDPVPDSSAAALTAPTGSAPSTPSGAATGAGRQGAAPATASSTPAAVGEVAGGSPTVVVSVVGKVAAPGLVTLPVGSRVADAVAAAGGLAPDAEPASVNLAAVVTDGQQVAVGVPGAAVGTAGSAPGGAAAPGGGASGAPVDLNSATVADLDALPGVGPVLAQRIVDHRTGHGRFRSVDQLDDVPGIGPAVFARLAPLVRV